MSNLCLLCDSHHAAHHEGLIRISGCAPDALVFERLAPVREDEALRYELVG